MERRLALQLCVARANEFVQGLRVGAGEAVVHLLRLVGACRVGLLYAHEGKLDLIEALGERDVGVAARLQVVLGE